MLGLARVSHVNSFIANTIDSLLILFPIAGEMLATAVPFLERSIHPIVIIKAFNKALEDALQTINNISVTVDITDRAQMLKIVRSCLGTKFASRWGDLMCNLALDAVQCVAMEVDGKKEVDTKRYARIEKVINEKFLISPL